jgi:hypothetical protein
MSDHEGVACLQTCRALFRSYEIAWLMSDRERVACLQVYRAFYIDDGHEGAAWLQTCRAFYIDAGHGGAACLQECRAFYIDAGHEGVACLQECRTFYINVGHEEAACWWSREVVCIVTEMRSLVDQVRSLWYLIVTARGRMPTKYGRFDIDCGREGPYAGHEGSRIDGDHKETACLQVYRAFYIDVGQEGVACWWPRETVCIVIEKRSFVDQVRSLWYWWRSRRGRVSTSV